jgi:hypothetical protein
MTAGEQLAAAARGPMRVFVRWRASGQRCLYGAPRWSCWHTVRALDGRTVCGMQLPELVESERVQVAQGAPRPPRARFCQLCDRAQASVPARPARQLAIPLPWGSR